jgi:acyl-CoA thioesterase I
MIMLFSASIASCSSGAQTPPAPESTARVVRSAPTPTESDDRPIILAFGDSLTAGYGVPQGAGYPDLLQAKLNTERYRYRVINAGISGDTTSGGVSRLQPELASRPAIVILELGANDGLRGLPVEETRANLDEMIVAFQRAGSKVILAGMTLPLNYGKDYVHAFEDIFKDLAKKHDIVLIPFFLEGVAGQPGLVLPDGIHPNEQGYPKVTEIVWNYLEPLLMR